MFRKQWISFVLVFTFTLVTLPNVRGKVRKRKSPTAPAIGGVSQIEGVRLPLYDRIHCHVLIESGPRREYTVKLVKRTYAFNEQTESIEPEGEYVLGTQTWSGRPPWNVEVIGKGKGLFRELFGGNTTGGRYSELEVKVECNWWSMDKVVSWNGYSRPFDVFISEPGSNRHQTPFTWVPETCQTNNSVETQTH